MCVYIYRYGNWGICYTYGTWFALKALSMAGKTYENCEALRKGANFLLNIQNSEGGFGESYLSCSKKVTRVDLFFNLLSTLSVEIVSIIRKFLTFHDMIYIHSL